MSDDGHQQAQGDDPPPAAVHVQSPQQLRQQRPQFGNALQKARHPLGPRVRNKAGDEPNRKAAHHRGEAHEDDALQEGGPGGVGGLVLNEAADPRGAADQRHQPEQPTQTDHPIDHHRGHGDRAPALLAGDEGRLDDVAADRAGQKRAEVEADHPQPHRPGDGERQILGADQDVPAVEGDEDGEQVDDERQGQGDPVDAVAECFVTGVAQARRAVGGFPVLPHHPRQQDHAQAVFEEGDDQLLVLHNAFLPRVHRCAIVRRGLGSVQAGMGANPARRRQRQLTALDRPAKLARRSGPLGAWRSWERV